jgi:hypothetical protein
VALKKFRESSFRCAEIHTASVHLVGAGFGRGVEEVAGAALLGGICILLTLNSCSASAESGSNCL